MKNIVLDKNNEQELYLLEYNDFDINIELKDNSKLIIYQYNVNTTGKVNVNLNGENAKLEYHFSTINYDDNSFKIIVNHNVSNTTSNIYNHGVNVNNNSLVFDVTGKVKKTSVKSIVNQENQIINLDDGKSSIKPNLLIDNYDVSSSHAAYIGKFKNELIYYLKSRGISYKKSIELLTKSLLVNGGNIENFKVQEFIKLIEKI